MSQIYGWSLITLLLYIKVFLIILLMSNINELIMTLISMEILGMTFSY